MSGLRCECLECPPCFACKRIIGRKALVSGGPPLGAVPALGRVDTKGLAPRIAQRVACSHSTWHRFKFLLDNELWFSRSTLPANHYIRTQPGRRDSSLGACRAVLSRSRQQWISCCSMLSRSSTALIQYHHHPLLVVRSCTLLTCPARSGRPSLVGRPTRNQHFSW